MIHHHCQTVSGLWDTGSFLFWLHWQKSKIFWNICVPKDNKQNKPKRAAETRCGTMCPRGMQHSLRHIFVCSTCEMGYLLRAHSLRPSLNSAVWAQWLRALSVHRRTLIWWDEKRNRPTHQAERFLGKEPTGNFKKGGNPLGQTPLLPVFRLLWWLFRAVWKSCRSSGRTANKTVGFLTLNTD